MKSWLFTEMFRLKVGPLTNFSSREQALSVYAANLSPRGGWEMENSAAAGFGVKRKEKETFTEKEKIVNFLNVTSFLESFTCSSLFQTFK